MPTLSALSSCLWLYVTLLFHFRIIIQSKKKYKLRSFDRPDCLQKHRFREFERSPRSKNIFDKAKKVGMSAFLGFLKYALAHEPCTS